MAIDPKVRRAAQRYGHLVDDLARSRYHISGATLLAKLVKGESGGRMDRTSSAGAKGAAQFMPGTRRAVLQKTGGKVDPWRSVDEAVHAATLHLTGKLGNAKGLEGYNPGMSTYTSYILGQQVGHLSSSGGGGGGGGGGSRTTTTTTPAVDALPAFDPGTTGNTVDLAQPQVPQVYPTSGVAAPSFSAGPVGVGGGAIDFGSLTTGPPQAPAPATDPAAAASNAVSFGTPDTSQAAQTVTAEANRPLHGGRGMTAGAQAAISSARDFVGIHETGGANRGPQIDKWQKEFGFSGAPWCGIFVGHVLKGAGVRHIESWVASTSAIEQKARAKQGPFSGWTSAKNARPGDLVLWSGNHVELVTANKGGKLHTIGGNTSDSVAHRTHSYGSVSGIAKVRY